MVPMKKAPNFKRRP